jgi:hypothetical protein
MSGFSRDWLRLREGADLKARSPSLARRFAAALPQEPERAVTLIDLGAGTGANCRALLPRIAGDQEWILIERDRDLIAAQEAEFTLWARRQGYPIQAGGSAISLRVGRAQWRITSLPLDLMRDRASIEALGGDAVTASALFDLVSEEWIGWLAALLAEQRRPLLAALTVDGRREWQPALVEDAMIAASFRQHQAREKGFGPALGGAAAEAMTRALAAHGFAIDELIADWRLDAQDHGLLRLLIDEEARSALEATPEHEAVIAAWRAARQAQLADGKLRLTIGHRDLLALPG